MPAKKRDELTPQEQLFVAAYIANRFDGKQAAIDAGYSKKTAAAQAVHLLARPRVQDALARHIETLTRDFKLSGAKVLEEMALIGFSDIGHYEIDETGHVAVATGAPANARRAVKKLIRKRREIPRKGQEPVVIIETTIELWSKDQQLGNLAEHLGLFREPKDGKPGENLTRAEREQRVKAILKVGATRAKASA